MRPATQKLPPLRLRDRRRWTARWSTLSRKRSAPRGKDRRRRDVFVNRLQERAERALHESRDLKSAPPSRPALVAAEHCTFEPHPEIIHMSNTPWRARREAYLRESGRTVDLIREGFLNNGLAVINGGGRRLQIRHCADRRQPIPRDRECTSRLDSERKDCR